MPQLHENLSVQFPPQAVKEYHLLSENKIIIFTGSKITGGFCVTSYPLLSSSKLSHILKECPQLNEDGTIILSADLMEQLNLHVGTELLSIRSSDIAFTMGAKGPLLKKAHDYAGIIPKY